MNVRSLSYSSVEAAPASADLLIATCGYETRSRFIAEESGTVFDKIVAYTYPTHRDHAFEQNEEFFSTVGHLRHPHTTPEFRDFLRADLADLVSTEDVPHIVVDVSSFCRDRLAAIISLLSEIASIQKGPQITVSFLYAFATFESHSGSTPSTVMVNEPLLGFEGWTSDPSKPVACLIGLGFEDKVALAALETLEPTRTVAFVAQNADERFGDRVAKDNVHLLQDSGITVVNYELSDMFGTLHTVEDVVFALRNQYRIALVPLGPKPFALAALLIGLDYENEVAVWRVSANTDDVQDRAANGTITGLRAQFPRRQINLQQGS